MIKHHLKPPNKDDLHPILVIYKQCEDFLSLGPVSQATIDMVLADLEESAQEGGCYCGIYSGDTLIGVVDYVVDNYDGVKGQGCLSLLMIAKPFRGIGVGRRVIDMVEGRMKEARVTKVLTYVQVNNEAALRFWQNVGYKINSAPQEQEDGTVTYTLEKCL